MAKEKDDICPHYPRWPFGIGLGLAILILFGSCDSKERLGEPNSVAGTSTTPIPVYEDRWTEIAVNPLTEEGGFDLHELGDLKILIASNNDIAHAVTISWSEPRRMGNGNTNHL